MSSKVVFIRGMILSQTRRFPYVSGVPDIHTVCSVSVCVCVSVKYFVKQTSFAYCKQLHEHKPKADRQYIHVGPIIHYYIMQLRCDVLCIIISPNQLPLSGMGSPGRCLKPNPAERMR